MKLKDACSLEEKLWQTQHIKKQWHCFADKGPSYQSYGFSSSHVWMWELNNKKGWVLKNWCLGTVVLEEALESPLDCKEIKPVSQRKYNLNIDWKDWCWSSTTNTLATWYEELTHWTRPWCWERLKAGGKGDNRGRDGWTASLTQWSLVWANSGRWWRTGKPDIPTVYRVIKDSTRLSNWTTAKLWMLQVKDNCKDDPWV